ncbi:MAG TPA: IDEAL domain-containing protein [Pseudogracilibacillus sp.]|nr:IDEAL domain-containing protein [Pseudogracilibacillus sp.]
MERYKNCQPNYKHSQVKSSETPYHMQLTARLALDEVCYEWNETYLLKQINHALDTSNKELFNEYSLKYKKFKNK